MAEKKVKEAETESEPLEGSEGEIDPNATADAVEAEQSLEDEEAEEPLPEAQEGHRYVRYVGEADAVSFGDIKFRPGVWTEVPDENVEELLTFPNEDFEAMEAQGDDG